MTPAIELLALRARTTAREVDLMSVRRMLAALAAAAATVLLSAAPAAAHGAPTNPLSREDGWTT